MLVKILKLKPEYKRRIGEKNIEIKAIIIINTM